MSWVGQAFSAVRRIIELDGDVQRLRQSVERTGAKVDDHERRLVRIETIIEFSRRGDPRLPR